MINNYNINICDDYIRYNGITLDCVKVSLFWGSDNVQRMVETGILNEIIVLALVIFTRSFLREKYINHWNLLNFYINLLDIRV